MNYHRATTRRAAGSPRDLACGPEAFPFLDRPEGEEGVRGAFGNSPPKSSETATCPPDAERDDGSLAGAFGPSAGQPSTPGTYGRLACTSLANRGSMSVVLGDRGSLLVHAT